MTQTPKQKQRAKELRDKLKEDRTRVCVICGGLVSAEYYYLRAPICRSCSIRSYKAEKAFWNSLETFNYLAEQTKTDL